MITIKKNRKDFVDILKLISDINDESVFSFTDEGIFIQVVDSSNITLFNLLIKKEMFDEYVVENNKYSISTTMLHKLVKKVGKKEINIDITPNELLIQNTKDKFGLKYYASTEEARTEPELTFTESWNIKTSEFFGVTSDMVEFDKIGQLNSSDELSFVVKNDIINGKSLLTAEKITATNIKCFYDITYLQAINHLQNLIENIKFSFGEETPCKLEGETDMIKFTWYLAPRSE